MSSSLMFSKRASLLVALTLPVLSLAARGTTSAEYGTALDEESHGAIPKTPFSYHYHIWQPNITHAMDMPWTCPEALFTAIKDVYSHHGCERDRIDPET